MIFILFLLYCIHVTATEETLWESAFGQTRDMSFSGISTFAHLPHEKCLTSKTSFDIGIIGFPFDTSVSYRPGARFVDNPKSTILNVAIRFGPQGIRIGSRRLRFSNGWSHHWGINPYDESISVVDCGDVHLSRRICDFF